MRPWKLEVVSGESGQHWVRFVGGNGEIVFNSETYPTRSGAVQAADKAGMRTAMDLGTVATQTAPSGTSILKGNGSGGFSNASSGTDYAPATSGTAILKGSGTRGFSNASAGTDYAPATSGSAILKGNGSGGFSNAASGTDYAPATSGSAILKGNGSGGFSSASSGTDYAPATSGTALLKGDGSGGFSSASSGSDYAPATSGTALLKGNGTGGFSSASSGTDYAPATSGSAILKGNGSGGFSSSSAGTDYVAPGAATSSGLTMATARLLGRTTASTGSLEEISIGSGLSLSAGSLSSTVTSGKILQVVQATLTTTANVTGTTFGSVFTASITPSVNTSKVLVMAFLTIGNATSNFINIRLTKSGTTLIQGDAAGTRTRVTLQSCAFSVGSMNAVPINYLDSPASTSSQTYAIEIASHSTGAVYLNRSGTDTDGATFSRGSSTIILMEVAA